MRDQFVSIDSQGIVGDMPGSSSSGKHLIDIDTVSPVVKVLLNLGLSSGFLFKSNEGIRGNPGAFL